MMFFLLSMGIIILLFIPLFVSGLPCNGCGVSPCTCYENESGFRW